MWPGRVVRAALANLFNLSNENRLGAIVAPSGSYVWTIDRVNGAFAGAL